MILSLDGQVTNNETRDGCHSEMDQARNGPCGVGVDLNNREIASLRLLASLRKPARSVTVARNAVSWIRVANQNKA